MPEARSWDGAEYDRLSTPMERLGREVLERLELRGDETLLDAGCGSGRLTELLLERLPEGRVIAVDLSPSMIEAARERLGDRADLRVADLVGLDLGGETVDVVFSTATFHWIADHDALFASLRAVLRPGGRLVAQCGGGGNISSVHAAPRAGADHPPPAARGAARAPPAVPSALRGLARAVELRDAGGHRAPPARRRLRRRALPARRAPRQAGRPARVPAHDQPRRASGAPARGPAVPLRRRRPRPPRRAPDARLRAAEHRRGGRVGRAAARGRAGAPSARRRRARERGESRRQSSGSRPARAPPARRPPRARRPRALARGGAGARAPSPPRAGGSGRPSSESRPASCGSSRLTRGTATPS